MANQTWPQACQDKLMELHPTGLSAEKMARELNKMPEADRTFTKNAVVGRMHRMDLPLRRRACPSRAYGKPKPKMTATEERRSDRARRLIAFHAKLEQIQIGREAEKRAAEIRQIKAAREDAALRIEQPPVRAHDTPYGALESGRLWFSSVSPRLQKMIDRFSATGCQFPHGEPSDHDFHFCGKDPIRAGSPWCYKHYYEVFEARKPPEVKAA